MKLDIKKIALILAASVFTFSGIYAQADRNANQSRQGLANSADQEKRMDDKKHIKEMFQKIKLKNDAKGHKVKIILFDDQNNEITLSGDDTETLKGRVNSIIVKVDKSGLFGKFGKEESDAKIDLHDAQTKEILKNKIKEALESKLKDKGVSVATEEIEDDGEKTLLITIQGGEGKENVRADKAVNTRAQDTRQRGY